MRKIMKRAGKEGKEGMKEQNKGSQLIGSSCSPFLMLKIKISSRITRKDRGRNTD